MLTRYETYEQFLNDARSQDGMSKNGSDWCGGTYKSGLNKATNGDDSLVSEAEKLLADLTSVETGEVIQAWQPAPMGAYPVVPEYLAGHPLCMRNRCDTEDRAPANIYVATTVSAGLDHDTIMKRGIAILSLVLKLQQSRPVNLFVMWELSRSYDESGASIGIIPIQSNPISTAHACNALTSSNFARGLTYTVSDSKGGGGGWPSEYYADMGGKKYQAWLREYIEMGENDLYIKPGHYNDELVREPITWINEQLARFNGTEVSE